MIQVELHVIVSVVYVHVVVLTQLVESLPSGTGSFIEPVPKVDEQDVPGKLFEQVYQIGHSSVAIYLAAVLVSSDHPSFPDETGLRNHQSETLE